MMVESSALKSCMQADVSFICQFGKVTLIGPTGVDRTKDGHTVVTSPWKSKLSVFLLTGKCVHEIKDTRSIEFCVLVVWL